MSATRARWSRSAIVASCRSSRSALAAVRAIRQAASGPRLAACDRVLRAALPARQRAAPQRRAPRRAGQLRHAHRPRPGQQEHRQGAARHAHARPRGRAANASTTRSRRGREPPAPAGAEGAWTAVTVAMADHLAQQRAGGHLLRDLGLVVVLLELCGEQRAELGGLSAETTRGAIAERAGLTVDRLDDCNQILEHAGVLSVERRRARERRPAPPEHLHAARSADQHQAADRHRQRAQTVPAGRQTSTGRAAYRYRQGGKPVPAGRRTSTGRAGLPVLAGRQTSTGRAADGYSQGGISATVGTGLPPSIARTRERPVEKAVETSPPTSPATNERGEGIAMQRGRVVRSAASRRGSPRSATAPAALSRRSRAVAGGGRRAAGASTPGPVAARAGLHARRRDPRLPSAHAARSSRRSSTSSSPATTPAPAAPAPAADCQPRAGSDGRRRRSCWSARCSATAAMTAPARSPSSPHTASCSRVFVERVRWSTLCEQPMRYSERPLRPALERARSTTRPTPDGRRRHERHQDEQHAARGRCRRTTSRLRRSVLGAILLDERHLVALSVTSSCAPSTSTASSTRRCSPRCSRCTTRAARSTI